MIKHKVTILLSSLSKVEINRLNKLVISPYFNKNRTVTNLYTYLQNLYPDYSEENTDRKLIFDHLFPGERYNDSKLRNISSDLTKLVEQYLILEQIESEPSQKTQYLLQAGKKRDLEKIYEPSLRQWEQTQDKNPFKDVAFYFEQHQLQEEIYEYTARKLDRSLKSSLQELNDNLDMYYLSKKLKYCCEMINRMNVFSEKYDMGFFEELMEYVKSNNMIDAPIIRTYYQILLTLLEGDKEEHYFKLKDLLSKYSDQFPQDENKINYSFAQNYCVKKINSGRSEYLQELFELYQLSLENRVIFESGYLSQWDFKNITTVGLRLGEMDKTKRFIQEYKKHLDPIFQENAYKYNLANYHFYNNEFKEAMQLLVKVEFTDIYYNLDSRSLLLKAYFELEEYEAFFPHSETFKNYIRRNNTISDYQKKVYLNLVKYLAKLAKLKQAKKRAPEKLIEEINTTAQIADATWLRKKAAST